MTLIFTHGAFWFFKGIVGAKESEIEVTQSCPTLCDPWTVVGQSPPSLGFSRLEYWSGLPCPPPGESSLLRDRTCVSCTAGGFFTAEPQGKPTDYQYLHYIDKSCQGACVRIHPPVSPSFWHAELRGESEFPGHLSLPVSWASFHTSNSFDVNYLFVFSNHAFFHMSLLAFFLMLFRNSTLGILAMCDMSWKKKWLFLFCGGFYSFSIYLLWYLISGCSWQCLLRYR